MDRQSLRGRIRINTELIKTDHSIYFETQTLFISCVVNNEELRKSRGLPYTVAIAAWTHLLQKIKLNNKQAKAAFLMPVFTKARNFFFFYAFLRFFLVLGPLLGCNFFV